MTLQLLAVLALGLMCGSELNVAAFAHPTLDRQRPEVHIPVRSSFAALLGHVMPFWMAGSTLLNLLLLFPFAHLNRFAWNFAAIALAIQVLAAVFSLIAPVPAWIPAQTNVKRRSFFIGSGKCGGVGTMGLQRLSVQVVT